MRITNNMILNKAKSNINNNKVTVDQMDTQMTTQQKISRPSEDPVVAIRSLRLQTQLSKISQYKDRNIKDAESWMDITDTSLSTIIGNITRIKELTNNGANDVNNENDRKTILTELKQLQTAIFATGNADCAGRTVFTGYRTDKNLVFTTDDTDVNYNITQELSYNALSDFRYYNNKVDVPANATEIANYGAQGLTSDDLMIQESDYKRLRLNYDDITNINSLNFSYTTADGITVNNEAKFYQDGDVDNSKVPPLITYNKSEETGRGADGELDNSVTRDVYSDDGTSKQISYSYRDEATTATATNAAGRNQQPPADAKPSRVYVFDNEDDWAAWSKANGTTDDDKKKKYVPDDAVVLIKDTGDLVFGKDVSGDMVSKKMSVSVNYDKNGFDEGDLKPEFYYDCVDNTNPDNRQVYRRSDIHYDIEYTVAQNQTLAVNLQANDCFDSSIQQDLRDLTDAITNTQNAYEKMKKIEGMKSESAYQDSDSQANLDKWYQAAKKEYDYYNDNMGKLFNTVHGNVDDYLDIANGAYTRLGCKGDELDMTKERMDEQQQTVTDLQSENDNLDLSEIMINYTSSYTAYQSSLIAAGRLGQQSLLNYI